MASISLNTNICMLYQDHAGFCSTQICDNNSAIPILRPLTVCLCRVAVGMSVPGKLAAAALFDGMALRLHAIALFCQRVFPEPLACFHMRMASSIVEEVGSSACKQSSCKLLAQSRKSSANANNARRACALPYAPLPTLEMATSGMCHRA